MNRPVSSQTAVAKATGLGPSGRPTRVATSARRMSMRQIITVVVLVLTLGLHWALLQSAAWVSMIVRFAQHDTLTLAVSKTFDGRHPCSLCLFVADGKKTEQQQQQQTELTVQKLEIFCETAGAFAFQESPPNPFEPSDQEGLARFERPPLPPPRFG